MPPPSRATSTRAQAAKTLPRSPVSVEGCVIVSAVNQTCRTCGGPANNAEGVAWAEPPTLELKLRHGIVERGSNAQDQTVKDPRRGHAMPIPKTVARLNRVGLNRLTRRIAPWARARVWGGCASRPAVRKHLRDPGQRFPDRHGCAHRADLWGRHRLGQKRHRGRRLPVADPGPHADANGTNGRSRPDTFGYKGFRAEGPTRVAGGRLPRSH